MELVYERGGHLMSLKPEIEHLLLSTAVKMALNPNREEACLGEIASRLMVLGEWKLAKDLTEHIGRLHEGLLMKNRENIT